MSNHLQFFDPANGADGVESIDDCVRPTVVVVAGTGGTGKEGHRGGCYTAAEVCAVDGCIGGPDAHAKTELCRERGFPNGGSGDRYVRVDGMGPNAPTITNENGASQSEIPVTFTTLPLRALWELAKLQKHGDDKYGAHDWRGVPEEDHLNHAFAHLMAHQLGDVSDDHLTHACWRLLAALELGLTLPEEEK